MEYCGTDKQTYHKEKQNIYDSVVEKIIQRGSEIVQLKE
jgi:hypothetical protein